MTACKITVDTTSFWWNKHWWQ